MNMSDKQSSASASASTAPPAVPTNDWGSLLDALLFDDPTLEPSEYRAKIVKQFPECTAKQVKNAVKRKRDKLAKENSEQCQQVAVKEVPGATDYVLFGPGGAGAVGKLPTADDSWEIRADPKFGKAVFAKRRINAGEILIAEKPAFEVDLADGISQLDCLREMKQDPVFQHDIGIQRKDKDQSTMKDIFELYDYTGDFLRLGGSAEAAEQLGAAEKTLEGIFLTNCIPGAGDGGKSNLCIKIARFNHSCSPNAMYGYSTEVEKNYVVAVRDIMLEEQICVSYLPFNYETRDADSWVLYSPTTIRQQWMERNFGRACLCEACSQSDAEIAISNKTRMSIHDKFLKFQDTPGRAFQTDFDVARDILASCEKERLVPVGLIKKLAHDICTSAEFYRAPCTQELIKWMRMRHEAQRFCFGADRAYTRELEAKVQEATRKMGKKKH